MKTGRSERELYLESMFLGLPGILFALILGFAVGGAVFRGSEHLWNLAYLFALGIVSFGGVNILRAKLPRYREWQWWTWGVDGLPGNSKRLYSKGWKFVLVGALLAVVLLGLKLVL